MRKRYVTKIIYVFINFVAKCASEPNKTLNMENLIHI